MIAYKLTVECSDRPSDRDFTVLYSTREELERDVLHYGCAYPCSELEKSRPDLPVLKWPGKDWVAMGYSIEELEIRDSRSRITVTDQDNPILDKIGQPITEGCIIAYGHALGRCAGIRIGKVVKLSRQAKAHGDVFRITVHGVDDDWTHYPLKLTNKKGTLQFPDRIIVLDPAIVPAKFMSLLEEVCIDQK
jgi:hypothetical protein